MGRSGERRMCYRTQREYVLVSEHLHTVLYSPYFIGLTARRYEHTIRVYSKYVISKAPYQRNPGNV